MGRSVDDDGKEHERRLGKKRRLVRANKRELVDDDRLMDFVDFARAKSVRSLDINLSCSEFVGRLTFFPKFPMLDGWDKLTDLSLKMVHVDDAVLEHGLKSHLFNLESLSIQYALRLERVVVASPKLKKLEIRTCFKVCSITIDLAPNLQCFIYEGIPYEYDLRRPEPVVTVNFKVVPKLSHVSLGGGALNQNSLSELQKVETLEKLELLGLSPDVKATFSPRFAMFKAWDRLTDLSLKSVVVSDADLNHFINNLESLYIQNSSHLKVVVVKSPKLKRLEMRWCCKIRSIDIDSAPNLEYLCYQGRRTIFRKSVVQVKDAPKLSHVFMGEVYDTEMRPISKSSL